MSPRIILVILFSVFQIIRTEILIWRDGNHGLFHTADNWYVAKAGNNEQIQLSSIPFLTTTSERKAPADGDILIITGNKIFEVLVMDTQSIAKSRPELVREIMINNDPSNKTNVVYFPNTHIFLGGPQGEQSLIMQGNLLVSSISVVASGTLLFKHQPNTMATPTLFLSSESNTFMLSGAITVDGTRGMITSLHVREGPLPFDSVVNNSQSSQYKEDTKANSPVKEIERIFRMEDDFPSSTPSNSLYISQKGTIQIVAGGHLDIDLNVIMNSTLAMIYTDASKPHTKHNSATVSQSNHYDSNIVNDDDYELDQTTDYEGDMDNVIKPYGESRLNIIRDFWLLKGRIEGGIDKHFHDMIYNFHQKIKNMHKPQHQDQSHEKKDEKFTKEQQEEKIEEMKQKMFQQFGINPESIKTDTSGTNNNNNNRYSGYNHQQSGNKKTQQDNNSNRHKKTTKTAHFSELMHLLEHVDHAVIVKGHFLWVGQGELEGDSQISVGGNLDIHGDYTICGVMDTWMMYEGYLWLRGSGTIHENTTVRLRGLKDNRPAIINIGYLEMRYNTSLVAVNNAGRFLNHGYLLINAYTQTQTHTHTDIDTQTQQYIYGQVLIDIFTLSDHASTIHILCGDLYITHNMDTKGIVYLDGGSMLVGDRWEMLDGFVYGTHSIVVLEKHLFGWHKGHIYLSTTDTQTHTPPSAYKPLPSHNIPHTHKRVGHAMLLLDGTLTLSHPNNTTKTYHLDANCVVIGKEGSIIVGRDATLVMDLEDINTDIILNSNINSNMNSINTNNDLVDGQDILYKYHNFYKQKYLSINHKKIYQN